MERILHGGPDEYSPLQGQGRIASTYAPRVLREINSAILLFMLEAASDPPIPFFEKLRSQFLALTLQARERLANCPVLLIDAGFDDPKRWIYAKSRANRLPLSRQQSWLSRADGAFLALSTMQFTMDLVRLAPSAATVFMGVSAECADVLVTFTIRDLYFVSRNYYDWFRPRWEMHPHLWRRLFALAMDGNMDASAAATYATELAFGHLLHRPD